MIHAEPFGAKVIGSSLLYWRRSWITPNHLWLYCHCGNSSISTNFRLAEFWESRTSLIARQKSIGSIGIFNDEVDIII